MKNNQKGFISHLLVAVFTLLFIGIGLYFYISPTQDIFKLVGIENNTNNKVTAPEKIKITPTTIAINIVSTTSASTSTKITIKPVQKVIDSPIIKAVVDLTTNHVVDQFVAGDTILVEGSSFNKEFSTYNWKVVIGNSTIDYKEGARNALTFVTPTTLITGENNLYVIASDGRKSNTVKVYVWPSNTPATGPASVTLLVNGSTNPAPVQANLMFDVSWSTTNLMDYACSGFGNYIPRKSGGVWPDYNNMLRSGSDTLFAYRVDDKGNYSGPSSQLDIGISCSGSDGKTISKHVYLPIINP